MLWSLPIRRRLALVTLAAVVIVVVMGIGKLQLNSHYTAYFDKDDPRLVAHQEISATYSRQDAMFVVLQSDGSFLDNENYVLLEDLSARLKSQTYTTHVLSITELGIIGETLTHDGSVIPTIEQLKSDYRAVGLLLSNDSRMAGLWVQLDLPDQRSSTLLKAVGSIRKLVEAEIGDLPVSAHYTGTLALNDAYIQVVRHDLIRIIPLLLIIMVAVLLWLLPDKRAVLTILPIGLVSVLAAFGLAGLFELELAAINAFVPVIILSISLAGCVHISLSYSHYRHSGMSSQAAALAASRYNLLPMALANGTTALGFLGLLLSPSPPIRVLAYLVVAGIVVSFILCMTLLPVLQARFDPWKRGEKTRDFFIPRLAGFVSRRGRTLIILFLLLSLPATWLVSRNVVSDNVLEYFASSHTFSRDTQLVENHLSGVNEVFYSLQTGKQSDFYNAEAILALTRFSDWLNDQPEVNRSGSIAAANVLQEAMQEDRLQQRLDFYRDRSSSSSARNPLLALAVSSDYSSALVSVYLQQLDSAELINFDQRVHDWALQNLNGFSLKSGGPALMFASLGEQNIRGMLVALGIALLFAALILGAVLRSWRVAGIGMVCNLLPVLLVYSLWAVFNGKISIGAAVVMGMILGIVLDDTIYLLTTYRRGVQQKVADPIAYAMQRVGPALVLTTITLATGLSLGLLSDFGPIWSMSLLSVMIIVTALLVDLLLLPALLPATRNEVNST